MLALEVNKLKKSYAKGPAALNGIDLSVAEGDFFALLGPNGAGKSTLIGILTGLVDKTAGQVKIFGHDIDTARVEAKTCLGLVPQEFNFNQFEKVFDIVVNQAGYYGMPRKQAVINAEKYLRKLDLWDKRHRVSRVLSGGMKRRLMIARALVHEPRMLILDEPTAGVDIELRRSMWAFLQDINAQGTTIILTTHYLEEAEHLCKGLGIIDHGELIENTTIKQIIGRLHTETIIVDLDRAIFDLPRMEDYTINRVDENTLEISFCRHQGLNKLFQLLSEKEVKVVSLRNKTSRLEELFVQRLDNKVALKKCSG